MPVPADTGVSQQVVKRRERDIDLPMWEAPVEVLPEEPSRAT